MIRKGTTRSGACGSIWFLAVFLSFVHQDDLILYILMFLKSLYRLVVVLLMFCIIDYHNLCRNEPKTRFLVIIAGLVGLIGPIL